MIKIENEKLSVQIRETGGTLHSLRSLETKIEYLWQGDKAYWGGQAPNLFPFVGRLYKKSYTLNGKTYPMNIHGFLSHAEMAVEAQTAGTCTLLLADTPETQEYYPYAFELRLIYRLLDDTLEIAFQVDNKSSETLYCGMGGHPGFNVPLEPGLTFEDYAMTFPELCAPELVEFSPGVLCTQKRTPYPLEGGRSLPLRHSLFTFDAVVLAGAPRQVTLASEKGTHGVTVSYPQMPYVGFWHKPNTDAPFICVEPWSVLPGREGIVEELSRMADMTAVPAGERFVNQWSIRAW